MKYLSVCSGIEAATVAWHSLGWTPTAFAEIEPFPAAVLAHHYPNVPNLGDMTKVAARILAMQIEAPDLLVGGTPCQAFSVAGLRNSLEDDRGQLSLAYILLADSIDAVRRVRGAHPAIILWENVPGVLSTKDNAFGCFLAGLAGEDCELQPAGKKWADAGCVYGPKRTVAWRVLDAQYFGLAQRRRRVFVVASAREGFDPVAVLLERDGLRRDTAPRREQGENPAATLTAGAFTGGAGGRPDGAIGGHFQPVAFGGGNTSGSIDVAACLTAKAQRQDFEVETFVAAPVCVTGDITHTLKAEGFDASEDGTGHGQPIVTYANAGEFGALRQVEISDPLRAKGGDTGNGGESLVCVHGTQDPCISTDTAFALGRNNGGENAIAFSCKDYGGDVGEIAPTLRSMGNAGSHANAGGQLAVAFTTKLHNTKSNQAGKVYEEYTTSLDRNSPPPALLTPMQVRRLTPVECERLQGFQDNYTRIPTWTGWRSLDKSETPEQCIAEGLEVRQNKKTGKWRVKDVDGPRYKALGNSMAVPCMRWIGQRIQAAIA